MTQVPAVPPNTTPTDIVAFDPFMDAFMARVRATGCYVGPNAILMQALGAASLEEATNLGLTLSGKDATGVRMRFLGVVFADSDEALDSRLPIYAQADVVRDGGPGEVEKLQCGAEHVVGVLVRACELDLFPFEAELEGVPLGGGQVALNLVLAPKFVGPAKDF